MDDQTYRVLDECYFLTNKEELFDSTGYAHENIEEILKRVWDAGLLRVYSEPDGNEFEEGDQFDWNSVWFVISKKGLQEHTSG